MNIPDPTLLSPEIALGIAYAPRSARPALEALWRLDSRLGAIVRMTSNELIGEMRLTWWREALTGERPARGEPLLDALERLAIDRAALAPIAEGWGALLAPLPLEADALERHGRLRGGTLFAACGRLLGSSDAPLAEAGAGWALTDFALHCSDQATRTRALALAAPLLATATAARWPPRLRPLGMLAHFSRRPDRRGSAALLLRALRHRLTGR